MVNVILTSFGLPKTMWSEDLYFDCYTLNRILYKDLSYGRKENIFLKYFKVWRCVAKVNIQPNKKIKIGVKTVYCVFIGYYLHNTTYRFLVINSEVNEISNNTIMESKDAFSLKMFFL